MRIWSLHPKHLDVKGLVALWRETLLAKNVLLGKTRGYKNHPQLDRFKNHPHAIFCIDRYLSFVYAEARERGYNFDKEKVNWDFEEETIAVNHDQIIYEMQHLLKKLKVRDPKRYQFLKSAGLPMPNPLFYIIDGPVESWEVINT